MVVSSSSQAPQNNRFDHPIEGTTPQKSLKIVSIVKPKLTDIVTCAAVVATTPNQVPDADVALLLKEMQAFASKHGKPTSAAFQRLAALSPLHLKITAEGKIAIKKTIELFQELTVGNYTKEGAHKFADMASNLLFNHLFGGALLQQEKVDALYDEVITKSEVTVTKRSDEECNNPSYLIRSATTKKPLALLKEPRYPYDASHQRLIENYPLYHSNTRELIGFEMDALFGFNATPATLRVTCQQDSETTEAIVQAYTEDAEVLSSTITQKDGEGGKLLKSIDTSLAHLTACAGIIKGLAAGDIGNYMFTQDATKKVTAILEFDHKECMVPFNKMPKGYKVKRSGDEGQIFCENLDKRLAELGKEKEKEKERDELIERLKTERKSIQMARLCILGLPQNAEPLSKAVLMLLTHPSLAALMEGHHRSMQSHNYEIQHCAYDAQKERMAKLVELARGELTKPTITITARDLYFDIFGGKELFEIAEKKYYPTIVIFNSIIGSSYRPELKDLSRPETMPGRTKEKPSPNPDAARNFQVLYTK